MKSRKIIYRSNTGDEVVTPTAEEGSYYAASIAMVWDESGFWYYLLDTKEYPEPIPFTSIFYKNGKTIFQCPDNF